MSETSACAISCSRIPVPRKNRRSSRSFGEAASIIGFSSSPVWGRGSVSGFLGQSSALSRPVMETTGFFLGHVDTLISLLSAVTGA